MWDGFYCVYTCICVDRKRAERAVCVLCRAEIKESEGNRYIRDTDL